MLSSDMNKTFDSLQVFLITKLKAYGFSEASLTMMRAFFKNRRNRIIHGSSCTVSEWKDVVRGYPQGSSFGSDYPGVFQNDI